MSEPRRWKTFSLRTLLIVVLLIGFSLTVTQVWGVRWICEKHGAALEDGDLVAPFVVQVNFHTLTGEDEYEVYFWFFGFTHRLGGKMS